MAIIFHVMVTSYHQPDYEAEATGLEIPAAIGIWEIISGLFLSAGVTYLTYDTVVNAENTKEALDENSELYKYLEEAYNTNLRVIEGTGGQTPSGSPSPSPSSSALPENPPELIKTGRTWEQLMSDFATTHVCELAENEWKAWRITVEKFLNQAYLYGDEYNILNTSSELIECLRSARTEVKALTGIDYKYYYLLMKAPSYPIYRSKYGIEYDLILYPPGSYCDITYYDTVSDGSRSKISTYLPSNTAAYSFYWRDSEGFNGANSQHAGLMSTKSSEQIFYTDFLGTNFVRYSIPLTAPDVAPYIGDRPSPDTVKTVPEIQPDPNSDEETKPYVIPETMPEPIKLPNADQLEDLYNDIQKDPENAPDAVKALQQSLVVELVPNPEPVPEPEPEPEPQPTASAQPTPSPEATLPESAGNYVYDFSDLFPFCIPGDLYDLLCAFNAEPEAPKFEIPFDISYGDIEYHEVFILDMSVFEPVVKIFRLLCIISFIFFLLSITRDFIKW